MALLKQRLNLNLSIIVPEKTIKTPQLIPSSFVKTSITSDSSIHQEVKLKSDLEILQVLGCGNGGTVYKVRHKQTFSVYALKVFKVHHDDHQEIEILSCLDSPYIVGCRGVFQEGSLGEVAVLLEFMDGGSLDNLVKSNGSFSECFIAKIAYEVLMGLKYLHAKGIVHCDIKPSNLLVDKEMRIKIADFGVSKRVGSGSEDSCKTYGGTAAYMSPERFGTDTYGCNALAGDVWSLGLTLMEFYMGHYPYLKPGQQADSTALMWEICMEEPPRLPQHASENFRDFVECCLQKDLGKRWTVSQLLAHPFVTSGRWMQHEGYFVQSFRYG